MGKGFDEPTAFVLVHDLRDAPLAGVLLSTEASHGMVQMVKIANDYYPDMSIRHVFLYAPTLMSTVLAALKPFLSTCVDPPAPARKRGGGTRTCCVPKLCQVYLRSPARPLLLRTTTRDRKQRGRRHVSFPFQAPHANRVSSPLSPCPPPLSRTQKKLIWAPRGGELVTLLSLIPIHQIPAKFGGFWVRVSPTRFWTVGSRDFSLAGGECCSTPSNI